MRVLKNWRDLARGRYLARRTVLVHCFQFVLSLALAGTPLFAQQSVPPDKAKFYLGEYAKLLATMQEARFKYSGRHTRSTPSEGLCAKFNTSGIYNVSAARKSLHYTQSGTLTWCNVQVSVPQDQGNTEVLVTPDTMLTVSSTRDESVPPETFYGIEWKQRVAAEDWENSLVRHELGLFLGYVLQGAATEKTGPRQASLLAVGSKAALEVVEGQDASSKGLVGFAAKTDDLVIRALFDPSNGNQLRQIEVSCPTEKVKPFSLTRATLKIVEIQYKNQRPSFIKLKLQNESSGGVIDVSELPENALVTPDEKKSNEKRIEPQTYESEIEITDIRYQEDPATKWFQLDNAVPNGTVVTLEGEEEEPYYWQDGKIKRGLPPTSDEEILESIESAFDETEPPVELYRRVQQELKSRHQHGLITFADPQHALVKSLFQLYADDDEIQKAMANFATVAVPTSKDKVAAAQELTKLIGLKLSVDASPWLVITDETGKVLGQLRGKDLFGDDAAGVDDHKLQTFLKKHSPAPIDARTLLADALKRASQTNKRVLVQQTATWCGPCRALSEFLGNQRSVWEKDYIWIKMDERWLHVEEVMKPIREDDSGGIPWMAILDAKGKTLATSDNSEGENIGFPSYEDPDGIKHFMHMLKSTAQRLTEDELKALRKALEKQPGE